MPLTSHGHLEATTDRGQIEAWWTRHPNGGRHYIFRQPEGMVLRNTTGRIAPRVDTRANGGYIVVPPSVVENRPYRWRPRDGGRAFDPERGICRTGTLCP